MSSERVQGSDILQPIPVNEWPLLQELLKVDWPKYANYYYWIHNSTKWKNQAPDLPLQIYCPGGNYMDDATFVGISSFSIYSVIVFTKDPTGKKLSQALLKTNQIDWSRGVVFSGVSEIIQTFLFATLATLRIDVGVEIDDDVPGCFYIKSPEDAANVKVEVPDDCYLGDLDASHIPMIVSLWPHVDRENPQISIKFLEAMVTLNKSIGLFLKKGNVLVSWALHSDWHGLGTVQTIDNYKRRGYAKTVVNALAKRLGEEGIYPILSIVTGNTPSENMFSSLNWKPIIPVTWIIMKKFNPRVN